MKNVIYWLNLFIIAYAVRMCNITELKKERTFCVLAVRQLNIQSYIIAFIPSPHLGLADYNDDASSRAARSLWIPCHRSYSFCHQSHSSDRLNWVNLLDMHCLEGT